MRSLCSLLTLAAFTLVACTATPEPLPTPFTPTPHPTDTPFPTSTPLPQREPLLQVAILGETMTTNPWALFDEAGASYWNDVTQADYWPRLYRFEQTSTLPGRRLEPAVAEGEPASPRCDSTSCTAIVTLQPYLTWTDGSLLSADDVAFTADTVMKFQLGLNWRQAYNSEVLERVEAVDDTTVRYYFKKNPTVADWQYGVLQGPILNQAYWQPRIVEALSLLPEDSLLQTIHDLEDEFADLQSQVDELNLSLNTMAPASTAYQDTSRQAQQLQDELNSVYTRLDRNRTEYETNLAEARAVLFSLPNTNEPTLGSWQFANRMDGNFENQANLGTPFGDSWFDTVRYITYPDELAAVQALENNEVDILLTQDGLSLNSVSRLEENSTVTLTYNQTRSARFLAFNQTDPYLADPILRQALACMLNPQGMVAALNGEAAPLTGYVLDDFWANPGAALPCAGVTDDAQRLQEAVRLLKGAGYTWSEEPTSGAMGVGLMAPDGKLLPSYSLLSPADDVDALRAEAARVIAQRAGMLGLPLEIKTGDVDELLYAVYGSGDYDMVLLGWRLSLYPAYLCEWFVPVEQNPFSYNGSRIEAECEAWSATNDLEKAQIHAAEIQSILMQDLPLIPLYSNVRIDAYRNIRFPFDHIIDGLSGLYSLSALAIPIP